MYVAASATAANVVFAGCRFQECSSLSGGARPLEATAVIASAARFDDCTFRRNSALFSGGAVYVTGVAFKAAVTRCTAERCTTGRNGGAFSFRDVLEPAVTNSSFTNCYAGLGGALSLQGGHATLSDSTLHQQHGNRAGWGH